MNVKMEKDVTEKNEGKDTIKIATIAAVSMAIKDNGVHRQFRYHGEEETKNYQFRNNILYLLRKLNIHNCRPYVCFCDNWFQYKVNNRLDSYIFLI